MALAAIVTALLFLATPEPDTLFAHDDTYAGGCVEDNDHFSTGLHYLYAESSHENLIVRAGSGVTDISVSNTANTFNYLGTTVEVGDTKNVFMITYTVTSLPGVIELCFVDSLGLWFAIHESVWNGESDGNGDGNDNTDTDTTTDIGTDTNTDTSTTTDIGTDQNTNDGNDREVISIGPIYLPDLNTNTAPKSENSPTPTPAYKPRPTKTPTPERSTRRSTRRAPFDFETPTPSPTATAIPVIARMASSAPTATPTPTRPRAPSSPAPAPTATPVPAVVPAIHLTWDPTVFPTPTPTLTPGPTATPTRIPIPTMVATPTTTPAESDSVTFARTGPPTATPTPQASDDPGSAGVSAIEDTQEPDQGGTVEEVRKRGTLIAALASAAVMSGGIAAFLVWRRRLFS